MRGSALTIGLLDYFSGWKSPGALVGASRLAPARVRQAITRLHRASLLQRADRPSRVESLMESWGSWNPAAGFYHFTTKNARYVGKPVSDRLVRERAAARRPPSPVKRSVRRAGTVLPEGSRAADIEAVLAGRRTWRRFGTASLELADLAALLRLTFGVQHWVDLGAAGRAMLRSSPSAGARHPLEAYVVARRASRLRRGVYHYDPVGHRLARIGAGGARFDRYLPGQPWFNDASALVFITAVMARTEWKYPFARAYRTVLIEAGHFAQTFCLAATALELAPFCSAALADTIVERTLRIDGVTESVLYACGVGTRPPGVTWAPWPGTSRTPRLEAKTRRRP